MFTRKASRRLAVRIIGGVWLLGAHASPAAAAPEPSGKPPLPPGEHPRLLFGKRDLGAIRRRVATPEGEAMLNGLRWHAHGSGDAFVRMLAQRDPI